MVPWGVEAHTSLHLKLGRSLWTRANKLEELGDEMREGRSLPLRFLILEGLV